MDIASLIGMIIGTVSLFIVLFEVSHGNFMMFYSTEGLLTVGCGTVSVLFMAMPMDKIKHVPGFLRRFMFNKTKSPVEVIQIVSVLAEKARKEGILAIESEMPNLEKFDKFMASGMRMAVDGLDPDAIEMTLRLEVLAMTERHKAGKKFFDLIKLYGPGWALAGTLIGQVGMFGNLADAEIGKLGHMLAIAVCATMYGTVIANAVAGPIGDKLALRSAEEISNREIMIQAILSIQRGDNPRTTVDKVLAFVPPVARAKMKVAA